jgi:hypothetical protein
MTKRHERLGLTEEQVGIKISLELLEITRLSKPQSNLDKAFNRFSLAVDPFLVSILYFLLEDEFSSRKYATEAVDAAADFFGGAWRSELLTAEKKVDESYGKRAFIWMEVFEAALLCGSVLGRWEFLEKAGTFPEPYSCVSDEYKNQDRDLYVAIAALLRKSPISELEGSLEKAAAGSKKSCKALVAVMRAGLARDVALFQKTLIAFLNYYKKSDFPNPDITKKISIFGTFFVHWAKKEGFVITIPPEFADHIVSFDVH